MKLQINKQNISISEQFREKIHEELTTDSLQIPTRLDILASLNNSDNFEQAIQWFIDILDLYDISQIVVYNKYSYVLLGAILHESCHPLIIGFLDNHELQGNINLGKPVLVLDLLIDQGDEACKAVLTLKELGLKTTSAAFLLSIKEKSNGVINLNKRGIKTIDTAMEVLL